MIFKLNFFFCWSGGASGITGVICKEESRQTLWASIYGID